MDPHLSSVTGNICLSSHSRESRCHGGSQVWSSFKEFFSTTAFKLSSRNRRFVSPASAFLFLSGKIHHCHLEVWRPTPHAWENRSRRNDIRRRALQVLKRFTQSQRRTFLIVFIFSGFGAAQWTILWWRWGLMGKSWLSCNWWKYPSRPAIAWFCPLNIKNLCSSLFLRLETDLFVGVWCFIKTMLAGSDFWLLPYPL